MKFALAMHGSRGDVEPCAALGQELQRRGHSVRMAVPPNLLDFVESAGLSVVAYGPNSAELIDSDFARNYWKMTPRQFVRAFKAHVSGGWAEMGRTLALATDGADLVVTGTIYQGVAANVAEYYGIPLAALHFFPSRVNGQLIPMVPPQIVRSAVSGVWWLYWRMTKDADDEQRRELGLPKSGVSLSRRLSDLQTLEIQAYDEVWFPGLQREWGGRWPFVGALTLQQSTAFDSEVDSWISAGTPPIYFGFGSMPVRSVSDTLKMITTACDALGERALICSGWADFDGVPDTDRVKVVRAVNHSAVFPRCRAVVHHGGAGTTAAGLRAGVPTVILWVTSDQPMWAAHVKRLKIGTGRRFAAASAKTLTSDLRRVLDADYVNRAREMASRMTTPAQSAAAAADLLEERARQNSPVTSE